MSDLFGDTRTMKAISLWQPWATLVALGLKAHETRHWSTEHRGPIAIHAAKTIDYAGAPARLCHRAIGQAWWEQCPLGMVVAIARLRTCRRTDAVVEHITRADEASGDYTAGRFAWALADVRPLGEPIPAIGRQGLFNWTPPEDLDARVGRRLDHLEICARVGWA
ncbi:ASCH domain-containing protein [Phenylobacterium sp.]|uniref:ASCH domain-containing protein n=1 Tax=Phenylobacterium sp. TaxID=1871053 RepID=UPI002F420F19